MDDVVTEAGFLNGTESGAATCAARVEGARDVVSIARHWLDTFGTIALATVIKTWGSSPVPVGGQLVVGPDDRFEGSVSGGCVEAAVITVAAEVMASGVPRCLEFGVADRTAWSVGLACGGRIEIFVERLQGPADAAYLDSVIAHRERRSLLVVETDLRTGERQIGREARFHEAEIAQRLDGGESFVIEEPEGRRFLHALVPGVHVVLVGAGHIAQVLSDLSRRVGFQATVIDPRTAFSSEHRFGDVPLRHEWPDQALPALGLDQRTAVVTLSHEGRIDDETLSLAIRSPCFYIGALGSRRTHEQRVARLKAAGFSDAEIGRIDGPVGLRIGAKGPAEIAVSILGAIIRARHGA